MRYLSGLFCLPFNINLRLEDRDAKNGSVAFRAGDVWHQLSRENDTHHDPLSGGETHIPVSAQIDVVVGARILNDELPFLNLLGSAAVFLEIDLKDRHKGLT